MKQKINYEQIIAGALLHFKKLDNVDINLILEDLKKLIEIKEECIHSWDNIGTFIKRNKNGTIYLKKEHSPNTFLEQKKCTLREYFEEFCGDFLTNYYANLNTAKFIIDKETTLKAYKKTMIHNARILLISSSTKELNQFKKYGFENIDYFNSTIRAQKYFDEHPEELEKYHLIIEGKNNNIETDVYKNYRMKKNELKNSKQIFNIPISHYKIKNKPSFHAYWFYDYANNRTWQVQEYSLKAILDKIIEWAYINKILEKKKIIKAFEPLTDYINPNRLPLPTSKNDLKILCLKYQLYGYEQEIAQKLGLNITYMADNNSALAKIINQLGEYDIIITTRNFSGRILKLAQESTEQCKDTGRELTLLMTYETNSINVSQHKTDTLGYGDKIRLSYIFGGNLKKYTKPLEKEYRVLRKISPDAEYFEKYRQSQKDDIESIIQEAVIVYNDKLEELKNPTLSDLDLKSAENYDEEYNTFVNEREKVLLEKQQINKEPLEQITKFDSLFSSVMSYLYFKKQHLIGNRLKGLKIIENDKDIYIENIFKGKPLCAITIAKNYNQKNLRILNVQTLTKKGTLSKPETIGLYTHNYDKLKGIPNRPNDRQLTTINSMCKKIDFILNPINLEAKKTLSMITNQQSSFQKKKTNKPIF